MSGRRFALIVAACLFALFVATNLLANMLVRGARLDLTENQLYSLSGGTREILGELKEPIELKFYFSRDAVSREPAVQAFAARVRELLQSYAANGGGKVRFVEVDPRTFTEAEDEAAQAGLQPLQVRTSPDPVYFGLVGSNAVDDTRVIPSFDQNREPFIEYEVTRLIYELQEPDLPKIGLITSLPIEPALANSPMAAQMGQSAFASDLGRAMNVEKLDASFTEIPPDIDVLAIIHPYPLTSAQLYAVDQFIMRKGRAFIALDPASLMSLSAGESPMMSSGPIPPASNLGPLLAAWGVTMPPSVVLDLDGALPVQAMGPNGPQAVPQPIFFRIDPERIDREDLATAWLQRGLVFGAGGVFEIADKEGMRATLLARTSGNVMQIPSGQAMARPTPFELLQNWAARGEQQVVAVHLSGTLDSAYPNGPPAAEVPETPAETPAPQTPAAAPQRLARSASPAEIILIADSDFLADDFYVIPAQNGGGTFADNGAFALNAIDILTGSNALVSLRSRAPSFRPMTLIDRLETQAGQRIEARRVELQQELERTQAELAQLQSRGQGSGYFRGDLGAELTPEERAELDRFTTRMTEVRRELRSIGRDLRADVDRVQGWVTFLNVWLGPLLVAGAGIFVFWRRRRAAAQAHAGRTEKLEEAAL